MALKLRRGTEAQRVITPEQGELIYVTDTKKVYVGDGATVGGILVGPANLQTENSPQLGGDLNLNGNDIIGTGNINISGTITATGNINLGNGTEDSINVGGLISSSLTPSVDDEYSLGTVSKQWSAVWATQVNVDTTLTVGSQIVKQVSGAVDSSTVLWDAETDTLYANSLRGDLYGSVLSDDSTVVFVDADGFRLSNGSLTLESDAIRSNTTSISLGLPEDIVNDVVANASLFSVRNSGIDNTVNNLVISSVEGSRDTGGFPSDVQVGDFIGAFVVSGYENGAFTPKTLILGSVDTATIDNPLPGKILFGVHDFEGNFTSQVSINSRHHLEAPIVKFTPFTDVTARNTALPTGVVEAGMVIFLQSTSKLQINIDGTTSGWVDIN